MARIGYDYDGGGAANQQDAGDILRSLNMGMVDNTKLQGGEIFSPEDFVKYGRSFAGWQSPDPTMDLEQWLGKQGRSASNINDLKWYQDNYGSMAATFNPDGTVTYDPTARTNKYSYEGPPGMDFGDLVKYGILAAGGAGLAGLLPGTTSAFSGLGAGGALDPITGVFEGVGSVGSAGGTAAAASGGGLMQGLAQTATGTGGLSQAELAALIESGTQGVAGGALESAAGLGTASLGEIASTGLGNLFNTGSSVSNLFGSSPMSGASTLSNLLGGSGGMSDWTNLLGKGLGALTGYLGSKAQTDSLENLQNQLRGDRKPFLDRSVGYLNDPNSFYSSPEATGAANAVMRQLSTTYGNPGTSPTAQSLATGALYDRYLNTVNSYGSLGLSGQGIQADLGKDIATGVGQPYAIAGNTIGSLTSNELDINQVLAKALQKQYGLI